MKRIFGFLLIIFGLCVFIGSVATSAIGGWFSDRELYVKEVPADGIDSIEIEAARDIHIIPDQRKNIKTVLNGEGAADMDFTIRQERGELNISVDPKWYHWLLENKSTLNVYVPESYDQDMNIHSVAGNLHFHGRSRSQRMILRELKVEMKAGDVDLQNLQVDDIKYSSMAGDASIKWVTAEAADFHSASGEVQLDHFTGSFRASLAVGDLIAQIDSLTGKIQADVTSGEIKLNLPPNADFALRARVTSGDIDCEVPCQKENKEWETTATNGNGKHSVKLNNVSGNIHVY